MTNAQEPREREGLLPCWHCGPGQSQVEAVKHETGRRWQIFCGRCGSSSGSTKTAAEAANLWNTRAPAPPSADAAMVEELRGPLRFVDEGHPLGLKCYDRNGQTVPLHPAIMGAVRQALSLARKQIAENS